MAVAPDTAAEVNAEGLDGLHRLPHIAAVETTGQKNGDGYRPDNFTADLPVMRPACPAQFLDSELGIPAVQQDRIDMAGNIFGLLHGTDRKSTRLNSSH